MTNATTTNSKSPWLLLPLAMLRPPRHVRVALLKLIRVLGVTVTPNTQAWVAFGMQGTGALPTTDEQIEQTSKTAVDTTSPKPKGKGKGLYFPPPPPDEDQ